MDSLESIASALSDVFGGDKPSGNLEWYQVTARAAAVFLFGLAIMRVGKNRMVGRVTPLDVLLGVILGSLLSRGITGEAALSDTAIASIVIVALHWLFTWVTYRSHTLGNLIKGRATQVVENGRPIEDRLAALHISPHDLEAQLRMAGIADVGEVQHAYEERNGEVSFVRRKPAAKVVEVRVQEGVQTVRIEVA